MCSTLPGPIGAATSSFARASALNGAKTRQNVQQFLKDDWPIIVVSGLEDVFVFSNLKSGILFSQVTLWFSVQPPGFKGNQISWMVNGRQ